MISVEDRATHAHSFEAVADAYERARPGYPPATLDWLLRPTTRRVLDLGAGTGKFTRQLHARGLDVVAVEPLAGMRAQLAQALPDVPVLAGAAEQIPLDDHSVDLVTVAQAWHWVDRARAAPEVARVLKPGGRLGLLWNIRDEREDWVAELGRLIHRASEQEMDSDSPSVGPPFAPIQRLDLPWRHPIAAETLLDLVASRSSVITLPAGERVEVLGAVRRLIATHPATAGKAELVLPYITRCARAELLAP